MKKRKDKERLLLLSEQDASMLMYCASLSRYQIVVAGKSERNQKIRYHPYCSKFIPLQNELSADSDTTALAGELEQIIRDEAIDVLMPSSFDCIKVIARHRARLEGLCAVMPVADFDTINILDNKFSFYQFCQRFGLAHPESVHFDSAAALDSQEFDDGMFPALWKPVWGAGEKLLRFENRAEFENSRKQLKARAEKLFPALLQKYFDGEDIDFNGFAVNGGLHASSVMRTTYCRNGKCDFDLTDFVHHPDVDRLGRAVVALSNFSGPLNIDMRIDAENGQVYLIEVNPRFWNRTAVSLMDGQNYVDIGVALARGERLSVPSRRSDLCWISAVADVFKSLVLTGDITVLLILGRLSMEQFRFLTYTSYANTRAFVRRHAGSLRAAVVGMRWNRRFVRRASVT